MPSAEAALLALRQQQIIADETGVDEHRRPARRLVVRRVADQRDRARRSGATSTRSTGAAAWSRRSPTGYPQQRDRRRGLPLPARVRRGRARGSSASTPTSIRTRSSTIPLLEVREESLRAAPGAAGADAPRARRRRGRGGAGAAARPGLAAGLVGDEPDARAHRVRRAPTPRSARCAASSAPSSASTASRWPSEPTCRDRAPRCDRAHVRTRRPVVPRGRARGLAPFEALDELTDEQLERPNDGLPTAGPAATYGPSRGLAASSPLDVAKELAVNERARRRSRPTRTGTRAATRSNDEIRRHWRALPIDEVRQRFRDRARRAARLPDRRARGALAQERRLQEFFLAETIDHYEAHADDLAAILASAGRS